MMKKTWTTPQLTVYGNVEKLTTRRERKWKTPGGGDDFCVNVSTIE